MQYYFGISHIIKVYNTDNPFQNLNKYSRYKTIQLAQQQRGKMVVVSGTAVSIWLCWTEHFLITIQYSYEGVTEETTRKSQTKTEHKRKQWWKMQYFFSDERKKIIINHMVMKYSFKYGLSWCTVHNLKAYNNHTHRFIDTYGMRVPLHGS